MRCGLIGKWRIVEADIWDRDFLDLVEPAYIQFDDRGRGEFAFGAVTGSLACEYAPETIFFTWAGADDMTEVTGSGEADLEPDGNLVIDLRYHLGDEAQLRARKW